MKRGFAIKMGLVMGSLCLAAWRLPDVLEKVTASEGGPPDAMAVLSALTGAGAAPAPEPDPLESIGGSMTVFSATGAKLTSAQKRELLEEALRSAPHVEAQRSARRSGGPVGSVRGAKKAAEAVDLDDPAAFMRALQGGSPDELRAMLDALSKTGG